MRPRQQILRAKKSKLAVKLQSVDEILRASYRKFTRDRHTRAAVTTVLR